MLPIDIVVCPYCGLEIDAVTGVDNDGVPLKELTVPSSGSASFCWRCNNIGIFEVEGTRLYIRLPSEAELQQIMAQSEVQAVIAKKHLVLKEFSERVHPPFDGPSV